MGRFGQINCCQSPTNRPIWSHWWSPPPSLPILAGCNVCQELIWDSFNLGNKYEALIWRDPRRLTPPPHPRRLNTSILSLNRLCLTCLTSNFKFKQTQTFKRNCVLPYHATYLQPSLHSLQLTINSACHRGGRHSSVDLSAPNILRPRVRIPSTASTLTCSI